MKIIALAVMGLLAVSQTACGEEGADDARRAEGATPTATIEVAATSPVNGPFLTANGFEGIKLNEPLDQGVPRIQEEEYGCGYARAETVRGPLYVMTIEGQVARVEVETQGVTLENGLGIGSPEADIIATYGEKAVAEPNKYDEQGTDYLVSLSENAGLIFNVSEGKVQAFRVGRYPELEWVEGCS